MITRRHRSICAHSRTLHSLLPPGMLARGNNIHRGIPRRGNNAVFAYSRRRALPLPPLLIVQHARAVALARGSPRRSGSPSSSTSIDVRLLNGLLLTSYDRIPLRSLRSHNAYRARASLSTLPVRSRALASRHLPGITTIIAASSLPCISLCRTNKFIRRDAPNTPPTPLLT